MKEWFGDWNAFIINYDDGGTKSLDKSDRTAIILDVIPQMTQILLNECVIGFWPGRTSFSDPGHVTSIDALNQKFDLQYFV